MTINFQLLQEELIAIGKTISGCNANGVVWGEDGTTEVQDRPDIAAVIAVHDPDGLTLDELRQAKVEELIYDNFEGFDLGDLTAVQAIRAIKILFIWAGLADKDGVIRELDTTEVIYVGYE